MFSFRCSNVVRKFYICKYFCIYFQKSAKIALLALRWAVGCATFGAFIHFKSENKYETHDY